MSALRLYAISIDEIRDMFGANEQQAASLREIAAAALPPATPPRQPGLLGKLGPIFRRVPGEVPVAPDQPLSTDLADQVAGRHSPPERIPARWRLLEVLVAGKAWGSLTEQMPGTLLADIDFSLACADVPSSLSLGTLLEEDLRLGLPTLHTLQVGFSQHRRALAMHEPYAEVAESVGEPARKEALERIARWLSGFSRWGELAPEVGRPLPDLVAFFS